jgi:hypothetical protein
VLNGLQALRGKAFRLHLHGIPRIEETVRRQGFRVVAAERTWLWEVRVFVRDSDHGGDLPDARPDGT